MSLGVLNNLSAVYAENNLNNTTNSLNTVLQQLSSGSKINSGADDAAGLSLVDGLQANQQALMQSQTNATEGVGLLQVADGALSQVTSLLNRAVTLATEASNGTLNTTQDAAANQEYQSILSEVNNIGTTTTYNQENVFNSSTNIYTGDSSTTGASIDALTIRSLSSSNLGDSAGAMSYSNGAGNVFLNLSSSTANAAVTDTLNASGTTTLNVNYLVKGQSGASSTATTAITVGTGTSYANTASGLISAINNSGLGLTADFTTQTGAGVTGGGSQTGISISGGLVSAGVAPSASSTSGILNAGGIPSSELLTQGQTVTVKEAGTQVAAVTVNSSINTLSELATAINTQAGAGTASVITNGDGSQSLALADNSASGGALTVTTTSGSGAVTPVFGTATTAVNATSFASSGSVTGVAAVTATDSSVTFGTAGTNAGTDVLSAGGSITLTNSIPNNTTALTFVVGAGTDTSTTFYTANHGDNSNTLANLAATINAESSTLGAAATVGTGGITVTTSSAATGENITASANTLTNANNTLGLYNPTDSGAGGTYSTVLLQLNSGGNLNDSTANLTGKVELQNGSGSAYTFIMGTGTSSGTTVYTGANTVSSLVTAINNTSALDIVASDPGTGTGAIYLQSSVVSSAITSPGTTTLASTTAITAGSTTNGVTGTSGNDASINFGSASGGLSTSDVVTGSFSITNAGHTQTFTVGTGSAANTTYLAAGSTIAQLAAAITGVAALGVTATANTNGLSLSSTATESGSITIGGSPTLADTTQGTYATDTLGSFASSHDAVSGTLAFSVGGSAQSLTLGAGQTVATMVTAINNANMGVTASLVSGSNGAVSVKLTSTTEGTAGAITATSPTNITDNATTANLSFTAGTAYNTGISGTIADSTTSQSSALLVTDATMGKGMATISYSDAAGANLSSTDLSNQTDAEATLTALNAAITDVAAQDGYIGAQINTLNSVSQVLSTQRDNVESAQNAVQATDYASATSNMSKYEILSQTGISALAQANSMQQEVTKLLQ